MRVLLIQPPVTDFYRTIIRTQPIGLAYLAASLRLGGFQVGILDCQTDRKRRIPIPPELSNLHEHYPFDDKSPFSLFGSFHYYGMDPEEIDRRIEDYQPDAVGISSLFTPYHGEVLEIARIVKKRKPSRIVVVGGSHASAEPESVLADPAVDYVVIGEGERRFPRLLEAVGRKGPLSELEGIGYRDGTGIRINPARGFIAQLDDIAIPARDLLDPERYRVGKRPATVLITSRGCPHRCTYCSARLVMGSRFRPRSPEAVVAEMKECQSRYGIGAFDIEDDNFTFDMNRAKRLMHLIMETFGERTIHLSAMNGVSYASLDGEILRLMKGAGFDTINLSFVSTETSTTENAKRPPAPAFDFVLDEAVSSGLKVVAYGIFGLPDQNLHEMMDTLIHLMERRTLIGPSIFYPSPGTVLFERCRNEGMLPAHRSQWRSSAFPVETSHFDRLDLVTIIRIARLINFLKALMDRGVLDEGLTLNQAIESVRGRDGDLQWAGLLSLLSEKRTFFGLKKGPDGRLSEEKIHSSRKVIDIFFEKAQERVILKTTSHFSVGQKRNRRKPCE